MGECFRCDMDGIGHLWPCSPSNVIFPAVQSFSGHAQAVPIRQSIHQSHKIVDKDRSGIYPDLCCKACGCADDSIAASKQCPAVMTDYTRAERAFCETILKRMSDGERAAMKELLG